MVRTCLPSTAPMGRRSLGSRAVEGGSILLWQGERGWGRRRNEEEGQKERPQELLEAAGET